MRRTDDGTALVEFVWLSLVLLVPLLYVLLAVFEVQRTAYAASAETAMPYTSAERTSLVRCMLCNEPRTMDGTVCDDCFQR